MSLNFNNPAEVDEVGVVLLARKSVIAAGGDSSGRQIDRFFDPRRLDGPKSCMAIVPRDVAESWLRHKGAVLRQVSTGLTRRLHEKAKDERARSGRDGVLALREVWLEVMKEPWPGDAEERNDAEERIRLSQRLQAKFYPVDTSWTLDQLRRYADSPELIAEERIAATEPKTKPAAKAAKEPKRSEPAEPTVDLVDEFLKSQGA